MKLNYLLAMVAGMALSNLALAQSRDVVDSSAPRVTTYAPNAPLQVLGATVLLDTRSGLINSPGTGPGGADESLLQDGSLGMGTYGFGVSSVAGFRIADDFVVPASGWTVNDFTFYTYQTGSTTTSTITGLTLRIWDGDPSLSTSNVVFGDATTNVLSATAFTNIFRGIESAPGDTNRPIMAATVSGLSLNLPAGTYWADFDLSGSLGSGPWAPPLTTAGQTVTGNGMQSDGTTWTPIEDIGAQGLPMTIGGSVTDAGGGDTPFVAAIDLPVDSNWLLLALLGGLLGLGALTLSRR